MSILETILKTQNGGLVKQLAGALGIEPAQAGTGVAKLLPALTAGMKQNAAKPDGLEALLGAIRKGNHSQYVEKPDVLTQADTIKDGNSILGHLLGNKDASRQVAASAAKETGLDVGILKKMLPMVAAMAMGSLSKQQGAGGLLSGLAGARGVPNRGLLESFLDRDNDGSSVDDLLAMAKKFF